MFLDPKPCQTTITPTSRISLISLTKEASKVLWSQATLLFAIHIRINKNKDPLSDCYT